MEPGIRALLLRHARGFIHKASNIEGVERIALIGSFLTDKDEPKEIDLLVTIAETADVEALAQAGRKLKGRCQGHNAGADIFLCNREGKYLGRTCSYRECHPRVACLGRQCHLGTKIKDDFDDVKLSTKLTRNQGLVLWPSVIKRVQIPEDVDKVLINRK